MSKKNNEIEILKNINDVAYAIKRRYKSYFNEIVILVCYKVNKSKYMIFQELTSFPITGVLYNKTNNSLAFNAQWGFEAEKVDNVQKKVGVIDWEEIDNPRNMNIGAAVSNFGTFVLEWKVKKFLKNDKNHNAITSIQIAIENIKMVGLYEWGFEVLSDTLNLIAVKYKNLFPYVLSISQDQIRSTNIKWTGYSFEIENLEHKGYCLRWYAHPEIDENEEDFDQIIESLVLGNKLQDVADIGQKKNLDLILDDED